MADISKDASVTIFVIKETMDTSSAARICTPILKIINPIALSVKL